MKNKCECVIIAWHKGEPFKLHSIYNENYKEDEYFWIPLEHSKGAAKLGAYGGSKFGSLWNAVVKMRYHSDDGEVSNYYSLADFYASEKYRVYSIMMGKIAEAQELGVEMFVDQNGL